MAPGTHGMSVPSCALERARRASVHTRILPFFVSASSCPVTVIVGQWGRAAGTGVTEGWCALTADGSGGVKLDTAETGGDEDLVGGAGGGPAPGVV